ncbi:MAG TPA: hypothetical protein VLS46_01800 [Gaiellaceae bacterium]|nr:hypothetical protein [Gaiellaceae bacterium]
MNPNFRKVALIAASLGLLVSLFLALSPDDDEPAATTTTAMQATTEATTTTAPATTEPEEPEVVTIRLEVPADTVAEVRRLSVQRGREVELVIVSEVSDHLHVHGYDLLADVGPGLPGTIAFTADAPGRFEIELEERGVQLAELEVRP